MKKGEGVGCAELLVHLMEKNGIKFVFGHPGEQILPFYEALRNSKIKHILMRHEQGAVHAADGYAKASFEIGVCISTAGPGALNMVMGVATAYKDSVPLLVITGDTPTNLKGQNTFQDVDQVKVFQPITLESIDVKTPAEAVIGIKKVFSILKNKTGPILLNLPKDVASKTVDQELIELEYEKPHDIKGQIGSEIIQKIEGCKKPLLVVGSGVIWSGAIKQLQNLVEKYQIPVATTYPARGVLNENDPLCLGMIGLRGTPAANYAGKNADIIIAIGCRLSERTLIGFGNGLLVHINTNKEILKGQNGLNLDAKDFISQMFKIRIKSHPNWLNEIKKFDKFHRFDYFSDEIPMKPQMAIKEVLNTAPDAVIVNDAGTHTTWTNLLRIVQEPFSLIFSGGFGPMGYAIPAAIGVSLARPEKNIIVVVGDGGFQMTSQELAIIDELQLPILIVLINNQGLGIIKQWQELYYNGPFQVELTNPDFIKLAGAYNIKGTSLNNWSDIRNIVQKALRMKKPYLLELIVDSEEGIPLPEVVK